MPGDNESTDAFLFQSAGILFYSAEFQQFSCKSCTSVEKKGREQECGHVASVVFLEGGSLCFQLGNVQAKLKLGEWSASQRLHCLSSA